VGKERESKRGTKGRVYDGWQERQRAGGSTSGLPKWPSNRSNTFSLWLLLREGLT